VNKFILLGKTIVWALYIVVIKVKLIIRDTAQENVMNAHGRFNSMVLLINLKDNNNHYYVDKPFEGCSRRQYYWMRNKEQYLCALSCSRRPQIGLLANPVDVHYPGPSLLKAASRLNPQWPGKG
jgi:hypothetical protein